MPTADRAILERTNFDRAIFDRAIFDRAIEDRATTARDMALMDPNAPAGLTDPENCPLKPSRPQVT
jgi:hypothetical protein